MYSKTFHIYEYSEDEDIIAELKSTLSIEVYGYLVSNNIKMTRGNIINLEYEDSTSEKLIYQLDISNINPRDINKKILKNVLDQYISKQLNTIFKTSDGYYLLGIPNDYINKINIRNVTESVNNITLELQVYYIYFRELNRIYDFIDINNENYYNTGKFTTDEKCKSLYNDYKQSCEDTWNIKQDPLTKNEDILEIIYKIDECIYKRSLQLQNCEHFKSSGHIGAIKKMERIRKFYEELLIDRLRDNDVAISSWKK